MEKPNGLVFIGSLDWLPNEAGVRGFVEAIWPATRRSCPEATFQVVGRNPSAVVRRLESQPGVQAVGTVPDLRPFVAQAKVVVPLWVGGGTRLKIFEAMAMQKAIVSTPLGAEGLDVRDGEQLVLAESNDAFAAAVLGLLDDERRRQRIAAAAQQVVANRFSAERVARQFERICRETVERSRRVSNAENA